MESSNTKRLAQIDPLTITESLGFQTFRRESRKPWSKYEDSELIRAINELHPSQINNLDADVVKWDVVAQRMYPNGERKPKDCRKRWCNSLDPNLKKGKWTKDEDEKLIKAYEKHGASWQRVSNEISGRTDDQCAKRYIEVLDPDTKDRLKPWEHHEDLQLIRQVKNHGTKWRTIALEIKGRPSLTCRNRWRKIVTDVVRGKADPIIKKEVDTIANGNINVLENIGKGNTSKPTSSHESLMNSKPTSQASTPYPLSVSSQPTSVEQRDIYLAQRSYPNQTGQVPQQYQQRISRPPAQSAITMPVNSEVEWKYTLEREDGKPDNPNLPHAALFNDENNGQIKNQELVQQLISYAKTYGLNITVHQHIHHHYSQPGNRHLQKQRQAPDIQNYPYQSVQSPFSILGLSSTGNNNELVNEPGFNDSIPPNEMNKNYQSPYYLEPETQLTRYQHFNYLPPLTEVPKLNSSSSPPSTTKDANNPTHHHHHHDNENENEKQDRKDPSNSKESDLIKLLNRYNNETTPELQERNKRAMVSTESTPPGSNSLTPLTQAVEMAAAAEAGGKIPSNSRKRSNTNAYQNKSKLQRNEKELEDGIDFWDNMKNLTDLPNQQSQQIAQPHQLTQTQQLAQSQQENQLSSQKPVSQHQSSNMFSNNTSDQALAKPLSVIDSNPNINKTTNNDINDPPYEEEEAVGEEDYGLFYNVFNKEGSSTTQTNNDTENQNNGSVYDNLISIFGMIPFNPS